MLVLARRKQCLIIQWLSFKAGVSHFTHSSFTERLFGPLASVDVDHLVIFTGHVAKIITNNVRYSAIKRNQHTTN